MNTYHYIIICTLFLARATAFAQAPQVSFTPQSLGDSVNSSYSEMNPVVSPDGKTLYFSRINHPENYYGGHDSQDVWYCTLREDGTWSEAKHADKSINLARYNAVYGVFDNGRTLLINGVYTKHKQWLKRGVSFIYQRTDGWSAPEEVNIKALNRLSDGQAFFAYMHPTKKYMLFSFSKQAGGKRNNIYISKRKKDKYKRPKKIKASKYFKIEQAPTMDASGDTIFFASNQKGDGEGKAKRNLDIFYIVRKGDHFNRWTSPVAVDSVNTTNWESYFRLNKKGDIAYFCSDRNKGQKSDIYAYRRWDDQPFIVVSGTLINTRTDSTLTGNDAVTFTVKKVEEDTSYTLPDTITVEFDSETKQYSTELPFGHQFEITATVGKVTSAPVTIQGESIDVHTKIEKDLPVTPLNYAKVTGIIKNKKTDEPVKDLTHPKIAINGMVTDSIKVGQDAWFELKLPLGKTYQVEAIDSNYTSETTIIHLEDSSEYTEIIQNLYVLRNEEKPKMATLKGKVFNKKEDKLLENTSFTVSVNGEERKVVAGGGKFSIELPLDSSFEIKIDAEEFIPSHDSLSLIGESDPIRIEKEFYLTPLEVGQKVKINHVYFEQSKATLRSESYHALDEVVDLLNHIKSLKIELGGHTDNQGSAFLNKELSQERARSVKSYLTEHGIDADRLVVRGYGEEEPLVANDTEEMRKLNRRVEFKILEK